MTCKTTETGDITLTIELAEALEKWIDMACLKRTETTIKTECAWVLWQSMEHLSCALWDKYYKDFLDKCLIQSQDSQNRYSENEIPF